VICARFLFPSYPLALSLASVVGLWFKMPFVPSSPKDALLPVKRTSTSQTIQVRNLMIRTILIFIITISTMGCASHIPIKMEGLQLVSIDSMQNNLSEDSYPGMMIASGNIYSCRYGIDIVRSEAFTPSKAMIFAALIKDNIPEIDLKTVSLKRFDVYFNRRLGALADAANLHVPITTSSGLVVVGGSTPAPRGSGDTDFILDTIPETYPIRTTENAVGCDGENEGEYYSSRTSAGIGAIVTWLEFSVSRKEYHFRSVYQIQLTSEADSPLNNKNQFDESIKKTIREISIKILQD